MGFLGLGVVLGLRRGELHRSFLERRLCLGDRMRLSFLWYD